jgi:hypothetical protein
MPSSAAMNAAPITNQNNVEEKRLSTVPSTAARTLEAAYRRSGKGRVKFRTPVINAV